MSSWIIARNIPSKKKHVITKYHSTTSAPDIFSIYMEFLAAYIFTQKIGESCSIWDPTTLINSTLKHNPQVKFLKEVPENLEPLSVSSYEPIISPMKFTEIQRIAGSIFQFNTDFNSSVIRVLDKNGIKALFDIAIHLVKDISGPNVGGFKKYADLIKEYQKKSKKEKLSIYIMADTYSVVTEFQLLCDPSWKLTSLSKTPTSDTNAEFLHVMAEVQVMVALPALILDFDRPVDRFIYLMQRNQRGLNYFMEINSNPWYLI